VRDTIYLLSDSPSARSSGTDVDQVHVMLSNAELAAVTGGNTCYVSNYSTKTTAITPSSGATTQLAQGVTTRVPVGGFTASQGGSSIPMTCAPGRGFVVSDPPARNVSWGVGTIDNRGR
jgi:hypothetical protein